MWFKALMLALALFSTSAYSVVILQYHHVSNTTPASTSISVEQFAMHMAHLKNQKYNVLPLSHIIKQLKKGKNLPDKTVAITFDDGYLNVLTNAAPLLKQYEFPYTLFVSPKEISARHSNMLSWAQLKAMQQDGVEIANHSLTHLHLNRRIMVKALVQESEEQDKPLADDTEAAVETPDKEVQSTEPVTIEILENQAQWLARISSDITSAEQQIVEHTGANLKMLAYPYGEYNSALQALVKKLGYVGIGQHSGAISSKSDFTALPRFPASGRYASLKTLKIKLQSLAMQVLSLGNANPQLDQHSESKFPKRPLLTVKINVKDIFVQTLQCYILGEAVKPRWLNKQQFSISSPIDLPAGRSRYNCTAKSRSKYGYYWFSQPWINRHNDGTWYDN
ncbi:MAG: polysaccharide deacetylase family protein [Psychrobium sp.]|nr:polysaccharide deacetylase family protein [Psychrobium sp.]